MIKERKNEKLKQGNLTMAKLDFGLLLAFRNPPTWRRPWDEIYEEHNQAKVAEELATTPFG